MEKTYVFDTAADKGSLDSSAIIASLMNNRGVDPNLMAMLTNASKNQDAWGGGGCWWRLSAGRRMELNENLMKSEKRTKETWIFSRY